MNKKSQINLCKNRSSKQNSVLSNHQRIHRIQLKTIEFLSKYFDKVGKMKKLQGNEAKRQQNKQNHNKQSQDKYYGQQSQKLRDRYFSLSSQNIQKIQSDLQNRYKIYQQISTVQNMKKLTKKISKLQQRSKQFQKQFQQHQKQIIKNLSKKNYFGSTWLNIKDTKGMKVKQEWYQKNKMQMGKGRAKSLYSGGEFFKRDNTTDYKFQRKRIVDRIEKLNRKIQYEVRNKKNNDIILFKVEQSQQLQNYKTNLNENLSKISQYQRQNKFIKKFQINDYNSNNKRSIKSLQTMNKNHRYSTEPTLLSQNLKQKQIKQKNYQKQSLGWGLKHVDMSNFYSSYQKLALPIRKNLNQIKSRFPLKIQKSKIRDKSISLRIQKKQPNHELNVDTRRKSIQIDLNDRKENDDVKMQKLVQRQNSINKQKSKEKGQKIPFNFISNIGDSRNSITNISPFRKIKADQPRKQRDHNIKFNIFKQKQNQRKVLAL